MELESIPETCRYVKLLFNIYKWIFMKLAVYDRHQNISLEFDFEGT